MENDAPRDRAVFRGRFVHRLIVSRSQSHYFFYFSINSHFFISFLALLRFRCYLQFCAEGACR